MGFVFYGERTMVRSGEVEEMTHFCLPELKRGVNQIIIHIPIE